MNVRQATIADLEKLVPLFDAYRMFYRQPSEPALANQFLLERLQRQESTIFIALDEHERALGFTQLYPSFSSVSAARILILNDLFVASDSRRLGVAASLLSAAVAYGRTVGAVRLTLSTEVTNTSAQSLYEKEGWQRQTQFYSYDYNG